MNTAREADCATDYYRVSQLATLINGFPFDSADFSSDADVPLVRIRDLSTPPFETYVPRDVVPAFAFIRNRDVVIGMDGDFNSVLWQRGEAALNQRVCLLRARPGVDPRFIAYAIPPHLQRINDLTWSTTVKHLSAGSVRAIRVPAHSPERQRAIADYLDRETAQIDAFIAKNEELITLLTERRATVIDRSVFGLGDEGEPIEHRVPDFVEELAALKDFIRRTPTGWGIARFKSVTRRRAIRNVDGSATMRSLKTTGEVVRRTSQQSPDDSSIPRYLLVEPDDLVVNPMWLVGGAIGVSTRHGAVSPDYRVFRPRTELVPRFLHHLLRSRPYRAQYELFTRADTTFDRRVNQPDLDRLPIPIPPLEEQMSIAAAIDRELDRIDDTIEVAKRSIELARERRAALISAAVTGKIDVGVAV